MSASKLTVANFALSLIGAARLTTFGETTTEEGRVINAVYDDIRDEVLMEHPWSFAQKRTSLVNMTRSEDIDNWVTATAYEVDDLVYDPTLTKYYKCLIAHTSTTLFATDLAAVKWELYTDWVTSTIYDVGDKAYNAGIEYACLVNHSSGTFATDLTAIKWVATEKLALTDDGIDVVYYLPTDFLKQILMSDVTAIVKLEGTRLLSDTSGLKMIYTYSNDTPSSYSAQFRTALSTRLAAEICYNIVGSAQKAQTLIEKYEKIDLPKACGSDSQQGSAPELLQDEWIDSMQQGSSSIAGKAGQATWHPGT